MKHFLYVVSLMTTALLFSCCGEKEKPARVLYEPRPAADPTPAYIAASPETIAVESPAAQNIINPPPMDSKFRERVEAAKNNTGSLIVLAIEFLTRTQVGQKLSFDDMFLIQDKLSALGSANRLRIEKRTSKKEWTQYYIFIDIPNGEYYHSYICTDTPTNVVTSVYVNASSYAREDGRPG